MRVWGFCWMSDCIINRIFFQWKAKINTCIKKAVPANIITTAELEIPHIAERITFMFVEIHLGSRITFNICSFFFYKFVNNLKFNLLKTRTSDSPKRCTFTNVKIVGVDVLAVIHFPVSALELISMCQPSLWLPFASKSMPLRRRAETISCSVLRVVG